MQLQESHKRQDFSEAEPETGISRCLLKSKISPQLLHLAVSCCLFRFRLTGNWQLAAGN